VETVAVTVAVAAEVAVVVAVVMIFYLNAGFIALEY